MALTPEQIAKYRYDGYLYPISALSPDELAECNAGLARFEEWLGKPVNQGDWRWRSAAYVFLPWLDRLARHPRILDAVESVLGPDILVFTSTFFIKEAQSPTFAAWHQDATYFGIEPYEHVTAWFALSDARRKPAAWRSSRRAASSSNCTTPRSTRFAPPLVLSRALGAAGTRCRGQIPGLD